MKEHLVRSHLGGYYISTADIDFLEEICDQCYDRDEVITSWEENDEKEQFEALLPCCYSESYFVLKGNSEEDQFNNWLLGYDDCDINEEITDIFAYVKDFVDYLELEENISTNVAEQLRKEIENKQQSWQKMANNIQTQEFIKTKKYRKN